MKVRIGFVPCHRVPFDEGWARDLRRRCLEAFSRIEDMEVVVPDESITPGGLVRNDEDAEKTIKLFRDKDVDGIAIGTMTFGDEISAVSIPEAFPKVPVLLFGTKEGPFTSEGRRRSDSFCGTLSVSSGLHRRKIPFVFAGIFFPEEEGFLKKITSFLGTSLAVRNFIGARIGLVGPRPERFETCATDESILVGRFSQRVVPVSLLEILASARARGDEDPNVLSIVREIKDELDCSGVSDDVLLRIAKLELALEDFARRKKLSGMGIQCWTAIEHEYGVVPCLAMGRITEKGIMCSCEVDILGALTMVVQYNAALRKTVPHFIDWTIMHQELEDVFLAWHCGNASPCLSRGKGRITYQSVLGDTIGREKSFGTAEFQLKEGVVTLNRLVEYDGHFKMLISKGEIIPEDRDLRGSWSWVKVEDLDSLYRVLVEEGFIHHASMIHGDYAEAIADFCKIVGIEAVMG
jgi:L-fucose isomerase-like protein